MGEKPSEGMPSTRKYEASVAAGKISGATLCPCAASDAVKAPHQGFAAASVDVTAALLSSRSRFACARNDMGHARHGACTCRPGSSTHRARLDGEADGEVERGRRPLLANHTLDAVHLGATHGRQPHVKARLRRGGLQVHGEARVGEGRRCVLRHAALETHHVDGDDFARRSLAALHAGARVRQHARHAAAALRTFTRSNCCARKAKMRASAP